MAQVIVRNLEDDVKERLQQRARRHNRSMEEEIREILRSAVQENVAPPLRLGSQIACRFAGLGLADSLPELHGEPPRPAELEP
ncbi:MAG: toxin-antitoxin system [Gammaproteobacteria bacterium]